MKSVKKFSMIVMLSIWATALCAQYSIGVRGGVTFPDMKEMLDNEVMNKGYEQYSGGTAAFFAEFNLHEHFAIQPELVFIQKGTKSFSTNYKMRLNYLEVPILAKLKFSTDIFHTYLMAGPTFGYAINGFEKFGDEKETIENWDGFHRFEVGSNVGFGLGMNAGKGILVLDMRYMHSLSNLADKDMVKSYNKGLILSVAFMKEIK